MPTLFDQIKIAAAALIRQSALEIQAFAEKIPPALVKKKAELEEALKVRQMAAMQRVPSPSKARNERERPLKANVKAARKPRASKATKPVKRRAVKTKKKIK